MLVTTKEIFSKYNNSRGFIGDDGVYNLLRDTGFLTNVPSNHEDTHDDHGSHDDHGNHDGHDHGHHGHHHRKKREVQGDHVNKRITNVRLKHFVNKYRVFKKTNRRE